MKHQDQGGTAERRQNKKERKKRKAKRDRKLMYQKFDKSIEQAHQLTDQMVKDLKRLLMGQDSTANFSPQQSDSPSSDSSTSTEEPDPIR